VVRRDFDCIKQLLGQSVLIMIWVANGCATIPFEHQWHGLFQRRAIAVPTAKTGSWIPHP
jgi:hypothetical protein